VGLLTKINIENGLIFLFQKSCDGNFQGLTEKSKRTYKERKIRVSSTVAAAMKPIRSANLAVIYCTQKHTEQNIF
jgi:hypothetical protein